MRNAPSMCFAIAKDSSKENKVQGTMSFTLNQTATVCNFMNMLHPLDAARLLCADPNYLEDVDTQFDMLGSLREAIKVVVNRYVLNNHIPPHMVGPSYNPNARVEFNVLSIIDLSREFESVANQGGGLVLSDSEGEFEPVVVENLVDVPRRIAPFGQLKNQYMVVEDMYVPCSICLEENKSLFALCDCTKGECLMCRNCIESLEVRVSVEGIQSKECPYCRSKHSVNFVFDETNFGVCEGFKKTKYGRFFKENTNWLTTFCGFPLTYYEKLEFIAEKFGSVVNFIERPPIGCTSTDPSIKCKTFVSPYHNTTFFWDTMQTGYHRDASFNESPAFIFYITHLDVYQKVVSMDIKNDGLTVEGFYCMYKSLARDIRRKMYLEGDEPTYKTHAEFVKKESKYPCTWTTSWAFYYNRMHQPSATPILRKRPRTVSCNDVSNGKKVCLCDAVVLSL